MKGGFNFLIPSPSAEGLLFCPKIPPSGRAFWAFDRGAPPAPPDSSAANEKIDKSNTHLASITCFSCQLLIATAAVILEQVILSQDLLAIF